MILEVIILGLIIAIIAISQHRKTDYPPIFKLHNFLTSEECDQIIYNTKDSMYDSKVYSPNNDSTDIIDMSHRKSKQVWIQKDTSPLYQKISNKVTTLTGYTSDLQEQIQIVKYEPGNFFNFHWDSCSDYYHDQHIPTNKPRLSVTDPNHHCNAMDGQFYGPRVVTVLVYLNDDYEGGETEFKHINIKIKPEKGLAVVFTNVDKHGRIYKESMHAGLTVESGTKYIANIWCHLPLFK